MRSAAGAEGHVSITGGRGRLRRFISSQNNYLNGPLLLLLPPLLLHTLSL